MKTRIVKCNRRGYFYPQYKGILFWNFFYGFWSDSDDIDHKDRICYGNLNSAEEFIDKKLMPKIKESFQIIKE